MAVKARLSDIANAARGSGFQVQSVDDDIFLVRPSGMPDLYERVVLLRAGTKAPLLVAAVAVSVIENVVLDYRGLSLSGSAAKFCTHPDDGKIVLNNASEVCEWLRLLTTVAPEVARTFAEARGRELLTATQQPRMWASNAHDCHRRLISSGSSCYSSLSAQNLALLDHLLRLPLMVSRPELIAEFREALAAVLEVRVPEVQTVAESLAKGGHDLGGLFGSSTVPDVVYWIPRMVVDMMVRRIGPAVLAPQKN